jgi:hypothetical protein
MLRPVNLVDRFNAVERDLPAGWTSARVTLTVADDARCDRAAALLGPANPARHGKHIRFDVGTRGTGLAPDAVRRLLRRVVGEGIVGTLEVGAVEHAPEQERAAQSLRAEWDRLLAGLPPDWSDLYAEIRLDSTDYVERGALLLAPLNPARYGGTTGLRFRCARSFGYGASAEMASRCLQRCDEDGITGGVEILRALSDTYPAQTQGPVWYVGGRSV